MEYLIVIIASILAGIGTGLVGLSAATAMVPLLIVLCPTFRGEHGAYMATAIALASDILGSAVTTGVYAKNKKIDLKHGWIMTACIISMCAAGSVAAFFTHQQVLGGFSLFLCVAIGIRFLVKPDSKKKESVSALHKLTFKEIAVSLFFGLTIGFGTGFFGSGGGMMMLIVFTAFLGYDRKTAVGTSTFIMTFTALIASVSHILIEPAIILECWDYLLIAIVTATVFSLLSAQFANKVNGKIVGIVTGVILLGLGLTMITLNYKDVILKYLDMTLLAEFGRVFGLFMAIIIAVASVLIVIRYTTKVPGYVFRKLLHIVAMLAIFPLVLLTDLWWMSVAVDAAFLVLIIVALLAFEKCKFYDGLFLQKGKHEVLISFICLFTMIGAFIAFCWGVLGPEYKYLAVAAIMAWGPGDGMAAIVGITWGKKKLSGKMIEGTKSVEGTVAMGITSFICTSLTMLLMSELSWYVVLPIAAVIGVIAAFTELFTKKGWDTITVPVMSLIIMLPIVLLVTGERMGQDVGQAAFTVENPEIVSIENLNDDEMQVTFSYTLNGETKTQSFTSVRLPDLGFLEPWERAHAELIDIDGDGTSEVVCKVYYIGNTFTELCGDLYIYKATESGVEPVLSLGSDFGVPDDRWITATYSTDTALYVETGSKRWEDGELYTDPIFYKAECVDGVWVTTECELPESDDLKCW